ncbi:hypothetical protein [Xanthomonas citri]|uniref:hypothetical protein n=1 Tax=Xanthomonas citri TaxID=346 RepID=UPI000C06D856|nr:hypothetical protein [Xanthomonas citri]
MARSPLWGRRIHLAGSIHGDALIATSHEVSRAREYVRVLVKALMKLGATFVVPVDAEKLREDGLPICFDWLIWETINQNLSSRPADAPSPLVVAVKHHKNEEQIPPQFSDLWQAMRRSALVRIESAAHWDMNAKRMEAQARHGDILITLGGGEGVEFLANLYHDAGKPVIPLNFKLSPRDFGSQKIYDFGLSGRNSQRLFQTQGSVDSHSYLNRIEITPTKALTEAVEDTVDLLQDLVAPRAFVVRLLATGHPDYSAVQEFFDTVVQPVMENELGYELTVVNGKQRYDHSRIDQEIFEKLHRSAVVVADVTGARPNCFIELGYALGRGLHTVLLAREGTEHPFDITSFAAHHWSSTGSAEDRRRGFREHWDAIKLRPALVQMEPLIP